MSKKMYKCTATVDVLFLSDQEGRKLMYDAKGFVEEEMYHNGIVNPVECLEIEELHSKEEVPVAWRGSCVYGSDDKDVYAEGWFDEMNRKDPLDGHEMEELLLRVQDVLESNRKDMYERKAKLINEILNL